MKLRAALVGTVLVATGMFTVACDNRHPCEINPTTQAPSGQWLEADGEPLDDDPCDADDLNDRKKPKKKKSTLPSGQNPGWVDGGKTKKF